MIYAPLDTFLFSFRVANMLGQAIFLARFNKPKRYNYPQLVCCFFPTRNCFPALVRIANCGRNMFDSTRRLITYDVDCLGTGLFDYAMYCGSLRRDGCCQGSTTGIRCWIVTRSDRLKFAWQPFNIVIGLRPQTQHSGPLCMQIEGTHCQMGCNLALLHRIGVILQVLVLDDQVDRLVGMPVGVHIADDPPSSDRDDRLSVREH